MMQIVHHANVYKCHGTYFLSLLPGLLKCTTGEGLLKWYRLYQTPFVFLKGLSKNPPVDVRLNSWDSSLCYILEHLVNISKKKEGKKNEKPLTFPTAVHPQFNGGVWWCWCEQWVRWRQLYSIHSTHRTRVAWTHCRGCKLERTTSEKQGRLVQTFLQNLKLHSILALHL